MTKLTIADVGRCTDMALLAETAREAQLEARSLNEKSIEIYERLRSAKELAYAARERFRALKKEERHD